jgi:hypothetical protein
MQVAARYELARELSERYWAAGRKERGEILDGFCLATGYNRRYGLEVLRGRQRKPVRSVLRMRQRKYGPEFRKALKVLWEASSYICAERLQPYLPELAGLLERHDQLQLGEEVRQQLANVSVATVERNLVPLRRGLVARKMSQTKPGTLLRRQIPVVVGKWRELDRPGYLEVDLVSHSGEEAIGEWVWTLCATDLSCGWTERAAVLGKGQVGIVAALDRLRAQLPFPLLGIHPDNGSEFLNAHLFKYCQGDPELGRPAILLSRSRPHHKNDNAHVEQKNWTLVRRLIGYQRLDTSAQRDWLDALYTDLLRPYNNCFQPAMKLIGKEVVDGHTRRRYDRPTTPLQRLLDASAADPNKIGVLVDLYSTASPLTLKRQIDRRLAAMPTHALEVPQSA